MKFAVVVFCAAIALAHAGLSPILLRTPQFDTAVINSDRFGANFAYSTVEGRAYQSFSPVAPAISPIFRTAYPYPIAYNVPYAFPAVSPYYAAAGPLPVISPFAPLPTLQIAGAEPAQPEKLESAAPAAPQENAENKPAEGAKADSDSITVESV